MKLRNKKTGHVFNFVIKANQDETACYFTLRTGSGGWEDGLTYGTLAELNEYWEVYKPKEPLIKDEKIRKAVRAWANSFNDVDEIKASDDYKEFWIDGYLIEFERPFDEVESEHTYRRTNIIELCGVEDD